MIKAFFHLGATSEVPLGETEFWITDVPRQGETVTLSYYSPGTAGSALRNVTGRVLHVQWTFEQSDEEGDKLWTTVDITLVE